VICVSGYLSSAKRGGADPPGLSAHVVDTDYGKVVASYRTETTLSRGPYFWPRERRAKFARQRVVEQATECAATLNARDEAEVAAWLAS
jgi:hypothetical protein